MLEKYEEEQRPRDLDLSSEENKAKSLQGERKKAARQRRRERRRNKSIDREIEREMRAKEGENSEDRCY